jgi:hypothetical protein
MVSRYLQLLHFAVVCWSCNFVPHCITPGIVYETIHNVKVDIIRKWNSTSVCHGGLRYEWGSSGHPPPLGTPPPPPQIGAETDC